MSLAGLVSIFKNSELNFARVDLLNDPHEGAMPLQLVNERERFMADRGLKHGISQMSDFFRKLRAECYVNCWAMNEYESEALWRLYGGQSEGVAIKSRYSRLVDVAKTDSNLYVGCVTYIDYETEWFPDGNAYYALMHKRRAFAHEHEVRIAKFSGRSTFDDAARPIAEKVLVNVHELIEEICVNPYSQEWYVDAVRAVVEKFAPALSPKVKWSVMKALPRY